MKKNFRKTLAVLLAVLMVASVFSVSVFAAAEYSITYVPGADAVETESVVETTTKSSIKIKGALFTRPGFTQIGWTTTEGNSSITNTFNSTYRKKTDLTLYPVWKGEDCTLTYSPGAYGVGAEKKVTVEAGKVVGLEGALYTREGYVQMGWSLTDGGPKAYDLNKNSDVISGSITLYPYWSRLFEVKFAPGAYGTGSEVIEYYEGGAQFSAKDAIFSRDGYLMTGWAIEEGGRKVYDLGQDFIPVTGDITLYPCWLEVIYDVQVSENDLFFGSVCEGYAPVGEMTYTITNNGNVAITIEISDLLNFDTSYKSPVTLLPGASYTVSVSPKTGLGFGNFEETITITVDGIDSVEETLKVRFSVSEHFFGEYISMGDATYAEDGHKYADCVKGCGERDIITDVGSKKVYSADNNIADGLASSYEHHRTVRFTAYGSGMDDAEGIVGKRYRPLSWYVNDEFNGEFADEVYDVVFTHTVYGEYTLTINYVEEEYDVATGEWVPTGETDTKTFAYSVGPTAEEEQEIIRPNTILNIIFGLFELLLGLLGLA